MPPTYQSVADYEARAHEIIDALASANSASHQEELIEQLGYVLACRGVMKAPARVHRTVAAFVRERMRGFDEATRRAISEWARRHEGRALKVLGPAEGLAPKPRNRDVAACFGIDPATLTDLLESHSGRRSLGWPVHLGSGEFAFDRAILDERRAAVLATLPEREPPNHHLAPLPPGYEE